MKEGTNMIATLQTSFFVYLSVTIFVVFKLTIYPSQSHLESVPRSQLALVLVVVVLGSILEAIGLTACHLRRSLELG